MNSLGAPGLPLFIFPAYVFFFLLSMEIPEVFKMIFGGLRAQARPRLEVKQRPAVQLVANVSFSFEAIPLIFGVCRKKQFGPPEAVQRLGSMGARIALFGTPRIINEFLRNSLGFADPKG